MYFADFCALVAFLCGGCPIFLQKGHFFVLLIVCVCVCVCEGREREREREREITCLYLRVPLRDGKNSCSREGFSSVCRLLNPTYGTCYPLSYGTTLMIPKGTLCDVTNYKYHLLWIRFRIPSRILLRVELPCCRDEGRRELIVQSPIRSELVEPIASTLIAQISVLFCNLKPRFRTRRGRVPRRKSTGS